MLSKLKYWSVYTLFRWQFLFIAVGIWIAYQWLIVNIRNTGSDEWLRIGIWIKVLFWAVLFLSVLSVITLLLSWIVFRMRIKSGRLKVSVRIAEGNSPAAGKITTEAIITNVLRPFLGTIQLRIIFPGMNISERINLDENKSGLFNPFNTVSGRQILNLHHRGLHEMEEIQVILTDMLKLLCIPVTLHSSHRLLTLPVQLKEENFEVFPSATEEEDVRINMPRRIQGEFLSYKDFESGDDIRRIVWKIYAKSGELVVRVPETRDPYASHVYIGAGFYNDLTDSPDADAAAELLNFYKDYLRQVYEAIARNQYKVKLIHDQEVIGEPEDPGVSPEIYYIATSGWQKQNTPTETLMIPKTAVICLSSAVSHQEVKRLFDTIPMHIPVFVFALSTALGQGMQFGWRDIFFRSKPHPLKDVKQTWWISPLRRKMKLNEQQIHYLIRQRGNAWLMQMKSHE